MYIEQLPVQIYPELIEKMRDAGRQSHGSADFNKACYNKTRSQMVEYVRCWHKVNTLSAKLFAQDFSAEDIHLEYDKIDLPARYPLMDTFTFIRWLHQLYSNYHWQGFTEDDTDPESQKEKEAFQWLKDLLLDALLQGTADVTGIYDIDVYDNLPDDFVD
ncbi:hypothetical protein EGT74_06610 [Chitinophaga lutea]|uniref:Uncharacterized protein n=1 Tax=Chitinophaga lutea TaxID=2488634 RepID=A0A3N4PZ12_9BACT|nr:hypothetical protein [Chitinophaga lutea]RPE13198.1 hypothetical protein EGT74_06610 [Chitinophaga lutea]